MVGCLRLGQIIMAPICLACMASESWMGLPLFVGALFKFGFPEVTSGLVAFRHTSLGDKTPWAAKAHLFADSVGYLVHHSGAFLVYAAVLARLCHALDIIAALPLGLQHAASIFKYSGGTALWFSFRKVII